MYIHETVCKSYLSHEFVGPSNGTWTMATTFYCYDRAVKMMPYVYICDNVKDTPWSQVSRTWLIATTLYMHDGAVMTAPYVHCKDSTLI